MRNRFQEGERSDSEKAPGEHGLKIERRGAESIMATIIIFPYESNCEIDGVRFRPREYIKVHSMDEDKIPDDAEFECPAPDERLGIDLNESEIVVLRRSGEIAPLHCSRELRALSLTSGEFDAHYSPKFERQLKKIMAFHPDGCSWENQTFGKWFCPELAIRVVNLFREYRADGGSPHEFWEYVKKMDSEIFLFLSDGKRQTIEEPKGERSEEDAKFGSRDPDSIKMKEERGVKCVQAFRQFLDECGYAEDESEYLNYDAKLERAGILEYDPRKYVDIDALFDFMNFEGIFLREIYHEAQGFRLHLEKTEQKWEFYEESLVGENVFILNSKAKRDLLNMHDVDWDTILRTLRKKIFLWSFVLDWWEKRKESINCEAQSKTKLEAAQEELPPTLSEPEGEHSKEDAKPKKWPKKKTRCGSRDPDRKKFFNWMVQNVKEGARLQSGANALTRYMKGEHSEAKQIERALRDCAAPLYEAVKDGKIDFEEVMKEIKRKK